MYNNKTKVKGNTSFTICGYLLVVSEGLAPAVVGGDDVMPGGGKAALAGGCIDVLTPG